MVQRTIGEAGSELGEWHVSDKPSTALKSRCVVQRVYSTRQLSGPLLAAMNKLAGSNRIEGVISVSPIVGADKHAFTITLDPGTKPELAIPVFRAAVEKELDEQARAMRAAAGRQLERRLAEARDNEPVSSPFAVYSD